MHRPKVLVLLAAYNGSRWIDEQITTILGQLDVDVDLVIADDCSTDTTLAIIAGYTRRPGVVVIGNSRATGSASQNFFSLIRKCSADQYDFVAFSDQDDIWNDNKLARACASLAEKKAAGYSCAVTAVWKGRSPVVLKQNPSQTRGDFLFEGAGQGCTFVLSASFYRRLRDFLVTHGGQTVALHFHDWATYAIARSWNLEWIFDQESFVSYRQHSNNDIGARAGMRAVRKRFANIRNGWYRTQLIATAKICIAASPTDPLIASWYKLLLSPRGPSRTAAIVQFCLLGSRRRILDKLVVIGSAMAGWI